MRIIARRTLREYIATRIGHADQPALSSALAAWFAEVQRATWTSSADVKRHYRTASVLSADRIVLNIRGNAYRLIVSVDFDRGVVWIKWIGSHSEYDQINAREVRYARDQADPHRG